MARLWGAAAWPPALANQAVTFDALDFELSPNGAGVIHPVSTTTLASKEEKGTPAVESRRPSPIFLLRLLLSGVLRPALRRWVGWLNRDASPKQGLRYST